MVAMGSGRIAAVLFIFSLCGLEANECPPASEILPCTCRYTGHILVQCSVEASSIASIGHIIRKQFSGKVLDRLTLTNVQEGSLKAGSFEEIGINDLWIKNSPMLKDVEEHFFEPMANKLDDVQFTKTSLTSISADAISKLKILSCVAFFGSKINQILKKDVEKLPKSLIVFYVTDSPLSFVEEGAFASLVKLDGVYLNGNQLKSLPSGNFHKGQKLLLTVHENQFSQVPFDSFSMLSQSYVYMNDNKIRVFPSESPALKKFFESGNMLYMQGNEMNCTCDMKWVATFEPFGQRRHVLKANCWDRTEKKSKDVQRMVAADFSEC